MTEIIPPIPSTLPAISDAEFDNLRRSHEIEIPDWKARPGRYPHSGYSHINSRCVTCKGEGEFLGVGERTCLCPCIDQYTLDTIFAASEIKDELRILGFEDAEGLKESADFLGEWVEGDRTDNAIIIGDSYSGKTLLASLIMRSYLMAGNTTYLTRPDVMRDDVTAGFDSEDAKRRYGRKVRNVDLLVIDEMDRVRKTTDFMRDNLDRILREREGARRPTLLVSKIPLEELLLKYSEAAEVMADMEVHKITSGGYGQKLMERNSYEKKKGIVRPRVLG